MSKHIFNYKWYLKDGYDVPGIKKHNSKVFGTFVCDIGDNYYMPSDFVIKLNYNGDHRKSYPDDVFKDLDLLFGGEE